MSDPEFEVYTIVLCCFVQASNLIEELNRVNAENKKLTEMLTVMCQNYNSLRNQLTEYMSKQNSSTSGADQDQNSDGSKKIKIKIENNNNNNNNNEIVKSSVQVLNSESSSSDEDSSTKKPREEHIKTKTSRVYMRTEPSDTSLVSYPNTLLRFNLFILLFLF